MSAERKGVTVVGRDGSMIGFPSATAFERNGDGSLNVYEGKDDDGIVVAIFEPGFGGAFMTDATGTAQ